MPVKTHQCLVGQSYLGNQNNSLLPALYHVIYKSNVDLSLATARYSMDQISISLALIVVSADSIYNALLLGAKYFVFISCRSAGDWISEILLTVNSDDSGFAHTLKSLRADAELIRYKLKRNSLSGIFYKLF